MTEPAAAGSAALLGIDSSPGSVAYARARLADRRARFVVADAYWVPFPGGQGPAPTSRPRLLGS